MPSWGILVYCLFVFDSFASNGKKMNAENYDNGNRRQMFGTMT